MNSWCLFVLGLRILHFNDERWNSVWIVKRSHLSAVCLSAFTPWWKKEKKSVHSLFLLVSTCTFNGIMDQAINNQWTVWPNRGSFPHFDLSPFVLSTLEMLPESCVKVLHLFRATGVFLAEHSNRPVSLIKIGLASVKQTQQHRNNTHFTSLIMRPSPSEPGFTSMSSLLCLAHSPHSSHFQPRTQIFSHLLAPL